MFGSLGMPELVVILFIALIVFGPRKLPELGRSLGSAILEFKKATNSLRQSLEDEVEAEARPKAADSEPGQHAATPAAGAPEAHSEDPSRKSA
jgi:sec-independent protein translocase protein TatA